MSALEVSPFHGIALYKSTFAYYLNSYRAFYKPLTQALNNNMTKKELRE